MIFLTSARANVVTNGSFETGTDPGSITTLPSGDTTDIPGWTVTNSGVSYVETAWNAFDGSRSIEFSGPAAAGPVVTFGIEQSFATNPGWVYQVTYAAAGSPFGDQNAKSVMSISIDGTEVQTFIATTSSSPTTMDWGEGTFEFTAIGTSSLLSFTGTNGNGANRIAVDAVDVEAVPEPTTWILIAGGVALLGAYKRHRV